MAENKTKPTDASVQQYLASRAKGEQIEDCSRLIHLLSGITNEEPRMWGPSIVGFGSYHYEYESGRQGEACLTGFAIRKSELVVYLNAEAKVQVNLLAKLGKHKMGKACLYFKRLSDLDTAVLEELVRGSVGEIRRRHGQIGIDA